MKEFFYLKLACCKYKYCLRKKFVSCYFSCASYYNNYIDISIYRVDLSL